VVQSFKIGYFQKNFEKFNFRVTILGNLATPGYRNPEVAQPPGYDTQIFTTTEYRNLEAVFHFCLV